MCTTGRPTDRNGHAILSACVRCCGDRRSCMMNLPLVATAPSCNFPLPFSSFWDQVFVLFGSKWVSCISLLTSYFTVYDCSALFSCLHAFFFNLSCKFSSSLMNLSLVGQVHVCFSDGFLFSSRHFFLIYHLSLC